MLGGAGTQEAPPAPPAADPAAPGTADPAPDPNAPAAPVVPEKYELALEGLTLDPELLEAADPVLRDLGLSNEQANKVLPLAKQIVDKTTAGLIQQLQDAGAAQKREWHAAFVADPEIGGAHQERTQQLAGKALDALGFKAGHAFRTALDETGFGNHPDMIRAFARLGELVGEDNSFPRGGVTPAQKAPWERLYPNEAK